MLRRTRGCDGLDPFMILASDQILTEQNAAFRNM